MLHIGDGTEPEDRLRTGDQATFDDPALDLAIERQRALVQQQQQVFVEARERFDRQRRRLKELEDERRKRELVRAGLPVEPEESGGRPKRKRSTTGMDALYGRDGIDPQLPLAEFRFTSLQRQEVRLNETGDPLNQAIAFVDKQSGGLLVATTFGEAHALLQSGHTLGRPGVPLQRQLVWYVEQEKPGRLRLDQLFVEREPEND